jgi:hypothetical protein
MDTIFRQEPPPAILKRDSGTVTVKPRGRGRKFLVEKQQEVLV